MALIEELRKTESLRGDEQEKALLSIKEKYNTPSDSEQIKAYLLNKCKQIESEIKSLFHKTLLPLPAPPL